MNKMNVQYEAMLGLVAEMVLDDAIRKRQRDELQQAIDQALASGDEEQFYVLTSKLQQLD